MTQSNSDGSITINLDDIDFDYTSDLGTTVDISTPSVSTITLDSSLIDTDDTIDLDWIYSKQTISIDEVEAMCKEYPSLELVYTRFKHVYDMCKQDYKGKLKERGLDDEIPF